jgi:hypothetical protein
LCVKIKPFAAKEIKNLEISSIAELHALIKGEVRKRKNDDEDTASTRDGKSGPGAAHAPGALGLFGGHANTKPVHAVRAKSTGSVAMGGGSG